MTMHVWVGGVVQVASVHGNEHDGASKNSGHDLRHGYGICNTPMAILLQ